MELWFVITVTLCISVLIKSIFNLLFPNKTTPSLSLPPGPLRIPNFGNFLWFYNSISISNIENILKKLVPKYGPILTLHIGPYPFIFISSRAIAHQALIQKGAVFADRPPALLTLKIMSSNQHNVSSSFYGPTWRILRRNLTSQILHPTRLRAFACTRTRVLGILTESLRSQQDGIVTRVAEHFQYAMFCLMVAMCFGDDVNEVQVGEVERVSRKWLLSIERFGKLNIFPRLGKVVFYKLWREFYEIKRSRHDVLASLARARAGFMKEKKEDDHVILCYVDTLLDLMLEDETEKRNLTEEEIVSLCSEFLNAGTDTTSTALEWVMANLVKYPHVQERLFSEIRGVMSSSEEEVKEDDLQKMPYLKAVILEGLRRHPPGHLVLAHAVTEDVVLDGYLVPKDANVNFMVGEMGLDPQVWEDPLEFKPERFLNNDNGGSGVEGFDITGRREIKMMPFGVGRRMCPGFQLALLHLEYFVANLVWNFVWKPVNGEDVDLVEKSEFTVVMKNHLQAQVFPRKK